MDVPGENIGSALNHLAHYQNICTRNRERTYIPDPLTEKP
jgi:hypothetical protein